MAKRIFRYFTNLFIPVIIIYSCSAKLPASHNALAVNKIYISDSVPNQKTADEVFFQTLFKNNPGWFDSVEINKDKWKIQIIYTQINRAKNGYPSLKKYYFNRNAVPYFYPASTVKFPTALLALQKINELKSKGITRKTTMLTQAAYSGQTPVYNDPNTVAGKPSIEQYIKKVFLVSDNNAFNRLYEFLGQDYINTELHKKGFTDAQLLHRLNIFLSEDENRHTNPVDFYDSSNRLVYRQPLQYNTKQYEQRNDSLGNAYYNSGELKNRPMDFSKKNRISLEDLNTILTGVIFPQSVKKSQRFNITEDDRLFVLKYMSSFPQESVYPFYDSTYNDAYAKFILYGGAQDTLPKQIRIFDKSGDAYGQLIDVAYVTDYINNIEFMVSAAIYCNEDGILNDDKYDYDTIGLPFMKNLGQALYDYELKRKRDNKPDLSSMKFIYDR